MYIYTDDTFVKTVSDFNLTSAKHMEYDGYGHVWSLSDEDFYALAAMIDESDDPYNTRGWYSAINVERNLMKDQFYKDEVVISNGLEM